MELTRQELYERKSLDTLRYYAGQRGLGIKSADVEQYLGKRVNIYALNKEELVRLHLALDDAGRGLGALLS